MYGLPKDISLKFFEQQELEGISVGKYTVILNFSAAITLTIQSSFASSTSTRFPNSGEELPLSAHCLLPLIGASVLKVDGGNDGTLKLLFSNNEELLVYDDDPNYESYVITKEGETVIVV